ncbi:RHS repeat-associated core domain-containing protein [Burkholderia plantarii]|uniref:RHS repeat-associated core domain-containing protein n=1 Tax=Burkholderia plantarii TaxID=41899 RepID=UPI000A66E25D
MISEAARKAGIGNPLRFAGQYFDRETGLHYNRHRVLRSDVESVRVERPHRADWGANLCRYAPNPIE